LNRLSIAVSLCVAFSSAVAAPVLCADSSHGSDSTSAKEKNTAPAQPTTRKAEPPRPGKPDPSLAGTWVGTARRGEVTMAAVLFVASKGEVGGIMGKYNVPTTVTLTADGSSESRRLFLCFDGSNRFASKPLALSKLTEARKGTGRVELASSVPQSTGTAKVVFQLARASRKHDPLLMIPSEFDVESLTLKGTADRPMVWLAVLKEMGVGESVLLRGVETGLTCRSRIAELNRRLGSDRRSMDVYMQYLRLLEKTRDEYLDELGELLDESAREMLSEAVDHVERFEEDAAVLIAGMKDSADKPEQRAKARQRYNAFVAKRTAELRQKLLACARKHSGHQATTQPAE
jgi:hypothetical protein